MFDIWSVFGLYLQNTIKYISNFSHLVKSGQAALRKLVYSEAGQTLASMYEWEVGEAYTVYSHKGRYLQGLCFKESCCHLLCKHSGLIQRNPGFLQCRGRATH